MRSPRLSLYIAVFISIQQIPHHATEFSTYMTIYKARLFCGYAARIISGMP